MVTSVRFRLTSLRRISWARLLPPLVLAVSSPNAAQAQNPSSYTLPTFQSDFGGVGLLQTPTARMAPLGRLSFSLNEVDPYTNYLVFVQPFEWMEAGFRYTQIDNRDFIAGSDLDYLDKGVDLKLGVVDERRLIPEVAVGFRDIGGTGLFSGEYIVANKRWYSFDFSLGLGWGYTGARGNVESPLAFAGERFENREGTRVEDGGDFNLNSLFTGDAAFFGGIQYQTPHEPLVLQVEYDGNDYRDEPLNNPQEQDSPINFGARYSLNDNVVLTAGFERGNTAMVGATLQLDLANLSQVKNDPIPEPPGRTPENGDEPDWSSVATRLSANAGILVSQISRKGDELTVRGQPVKYRNFADAELRGNRILHNSVGADISQFNYRWENRGIVLREDQLPRAPLPEIPLIPDVSTELNDLDYRRNIQVNGAPSDRFSEKEVLYENLADRFSWILAPSVGQFFGGPDGYLYKVRADLGLELKTDRNGWFSSTLGYTLFGNQDDYETNSQSELPQVRTLTGEYFRETELGVYNFQYTRTARLANNWFGSAYGGLLEQQFGGVGGEVLWRPFNSDVAIGVDANWVKQREVDTQFEFRDYSTVTGHATAYVDTGIQDVLMQLSVGRYLAKDIGTTLDLSREFDNGVRVGAFATITDAGDKFGEGSFDKGIYVSIPLDMFFTQSTRRRVGATWRPITRDGGAKLGRRYELYGLTGARVLDEYWEGFER